MFEKKIDLSFLIESVEFWEDVLEDVIEEIVVFFFLIEKDGICRIVFSFIEGILFLYDVSFYFVLKVINMIKGINGKIMKRN